MLHSPAPQDLGGFLEKPPFEAPQESLDPQALFRLRQALAATLDPRALFQRRQGLRDTMDPLALAVSKGYPSLAHKVLAGRALQGQLDPQALLHSFKDLAEIRGLVESRGPQEREARWGRMDRMARMAPQE